jgi:hypothetical protein
MTIFEKTRILFRYYLAVFRWEWRVLRRRIKSLFERDDDGDDVIMSQPNRFTWETYDPNDPDKELFDALDKLDKMFDEADRKVALQNKQNNKH